MKLADRHLSQLTVNDDSADRQFGVNLALSATASPPPYPFIRQMGQVGVRTSADKIKLCKITGGNDVIGR